MNKKKKRISSKTKRIKNAPSIILITRYFYHQFINAKGQLATISPVASSYFHRNLNFEYELSAFKRTLRILLTGTINA